MRLTPPGSTLAGIAITWAAIRPSLSRRIFPSESGSISAGAAASKSRLGAAVLHRPVRLEVPLECLPSPDFTASRVNPVIKRIRRLESWTVLLETPAPDVMVRIQRQRLTPVFHGPAEICHTPHRRVVAFSISHPETKVTPGIPRIRVDSLSEVLQQTGRPELMPGRNRDSPFVISCYSSRRILRLQEFPEGVRRRNSSRCPCPERSRSRR